MARDVLELERHRPAIGLPQHRQRLDQRLGRDVQAQDARRDAGHELGVSRGSSRSGSSAGSPGGSEPSGSRRAARWPWVRCAFTRDIAAATPPSSRRSGGASVAGCAARQGDAPFPPGTPSGYSSRSLWTRREAARERLGVLLEERPPLRVDRLGEARYSVNSSSTKPVFRSSICSRSTPWNEDSDWDDRRLTHRVSFRK